MSTRRSTRAVSQANSRGATPAISAGNIPITPVPRRTARRAGNAALPAVSLRPSTAYGSNTLPQPARMSGPLVSDEIRDVLSNLLAPEADPSAQGDAPEVSPSPLPTPPHRPSASASVSRRSRSRTPATLSPFAQRSYNDESNIFGEAGVDSSAVDSEDPYLVPDAVEERLRADRIALENLATQRLETAHRARGTIFPNVQVKLRNFLRLSSSWIRRFFPTAAFIIFLLTACLFLYCVAGYAKDFLGASLSANPSEVLSQDVKSINQRLSALEREVVGIKKHVSNLDQHSIAKLEGLLPDKLVVKKDKNGKLLLSEDFWRALQDKIRSDETLLSPGTGSASGEYLLTTTQAGKLWDSYIKKNKNAMETLSRDLVSETFPQLLKSHQVVTKEELIKSINAIWDEKKHEIDNDMGGLKRKLEAASQSIKNSKHGSDGLTKTEIATAVEDILRNVIPSAQLGALSQSSLRVNKFGVSRLNHFSPGTGAKVNLRYTSPNYVLPSNNVWPWTRFKKWVQNNPVPVPNHAIAALTPWEEHGDCWCTPSEENTGTGPSLGVLMGSTIYPQQVVIEHIPRTGSLEPGSAPKDMELLAHVPDPDHFEELQKLSASLFPVEYEKDMPYNYVRIAEWTYDIHSPNHIQAFDVGLDMKAIGAHTSRLIVRSKNNWGGGRVPFTCFYRIRVHGEIWMPPAKDH